MIAKTIFEQIGGRRFAAMTGSKDFIDMGNGLRMSLAPCTEQDERKPP